MFGGLYMRAIDPNLKVADMAVIEYVKLFHPIISTILSVAIVAALMSTACGLILVITTCISNDLFLQTFVKHRIIPNFVVDFNLTYSMDKNSSISFAVNNLFDKEYYSYNLCEGRNYMLTVDYNF